MSKIDRYYNQIKKKYLSQGFRKLRRTFVREKREVIQTFSLKHNSYGPICTVEFGIYPFCLPYGIYLDAAQYEVDQLIPELYAHGWQYDPNDESAMVNCIQMISEAIDHYILPFFERCSDCKNALEEEIKLEKLMNENRLIALKRIGACDEAFCVSLFHDSQKYYMALKAQNYGYAENFLRFQIEYLKGEIESFSHSNSYPEESKAEIHLDYADYKNQLEQLKLSNFRYFEKMLDENEKRMRVYLCKNYPTIWKEKKGDNSIS